jgi:hypothetical protein
MGPTVSLLLPMLILHHLRVYIYAILLSWFDLRARDGCYGLYIPVPATPKQIKKTLIKSFGKTETLIILRAPLYYRA